MDTAFINAIATAVPDHDVHQKFVRYCPRLLPDDRARRLFSRMAARAQVEHRYSFLEPHPDDDRLDVEGFYGNAVADTYPNTKTRMGYYERHAFTLAQRALDQLDITGTTHIVTTTCTGFYAPGIDHQIVQHYGLPPTVERTNVGFMGCYAALNALKLARHIVRSEPSAKVLVLNLELCTLHLKASGTLEEMLSFLIFSDGCAASLVSSQPQGLELREFSSTVIDEAADQITWRIGNDGFDMHLSGQVPATIAAHLPGKLPQILAGATPGDVKHWAVHPGGRTVLDAVRDGAQLQENQLEASREVLRRYGNMSSATVMFVLHEIMQQGTPGLGCAMAFGPGLSVESLQFAA
jgi:alpha-pyrone synthase